jgi:phage recombination protein Bet
MATNQAATTRPASNGADSKAMQYVPLGGKSPIKLSPSIVRNFISATTSKGQTASEQDCIKFMMLCEARGLNPFEGDAFLVGYDGKDGPVFSLITAHQAFLKRAELHPEFDGFESGVVVEDGNGGAIDREGDFTFKDELILGGWARVHFKNRKYSMYKRLSYASRGKDNRFWNSDPAGMICKCAEADALRASFPTLLGGLQSSEEFSAPVFVEASLPEIKPGRQRIAGARKPAQEEASAPAPVVNNETFSSDGDDHKPANAETAHASVFEFLDSIGQTTTKAGLTKIGGELKALAGALGEDGHKEVMAAWQAKYKALSEAK